MTPQEYCALLRKHLSALSAEEREEIIRYYEEFLADAKPEEWTDLGSPEALAARILRENGIAAEPEEKKSRTATIVCAACTFYLWIPLLLAWYILLLAALICVAVIPISFAAMLPYSLFAACIQAPHDIPTALMTLGIGLFCGGMAVLLFRPFWIACCAIVKFAKTTFLALLHLVVPVKSNRKGALS